MVPPDEKVWDIQQQWIKEGFTLAIEEKWKLIFTFSEEASRNLARKTQMLLSSKQRQTLISSNPQLQPSIPASQRVQAPRSQQLPPTYSTSSPPSPRAHTLPVESPLCQPTSLLHYPPTLSRSFKSSLTNLEEGKNGPQQSGTAVRRNRLLPTIAPGTLKSTDLEEAIMPYEDPSYLAPPPEPPLGYESGQHSKMDRSPSSSSSSSPPLSNPTAAADEQQTMGDDDDDDDDEGYEELAGLLIGCASTSNNEDGAVSITQQPQPIITTGGDGKGFNNISSSINNNIKDNDDGDDHHHIHAADASDGVFSIDDALAMLAKLASEL